MATERGKDLRTRIKSTTEAVRDPKKGVIGAAARIAASSEFLTGVLERSRASRLAAEARTSPKDLARSNNVYFKWALNAAEAFPSPFFYGPGDLITAYEALRGKEVFGRRIDGFDRLLLGVATAVPFLPGKFFIDMRKSLEDRTVSIAHTRRTQRQTPGK